MPIYAYQCDRCQSERDEFNSIDQRHDNAPACECGQRMTMRISPVRGTVQADAHYVCPATGKQITSHRQRRNTFAEHGLVDAREINNAEARQKRTQKRREKLAEAYAACPQVATVDEVKKMQPDRTNQAA